MAKMQKRKTFNEINITPLTDIFLVLLIIMMVVAPMLDQQGLNLSVPNAQDQPKTKESKLITVDVLEDGSYTISGEKVSSDSLLFAIQDKSKTLKDGLLIQASDEATHGSVVKVMDAARNAGVTNISVINN